MTFVKRLLAVLLISVLTALGFWIGVDNRTPATFYLLGFSLGELSLGLWMLSALSIGVLLGLLVTAPTLYRLRRKNLNLLKKLQKKTFENSRAGHGK